MLYSYIQNWFTPYFLRKTFCAQINNEAYVAQGLVLNWLDHKETELNNINFHTLHWKKSIINTG